MTSSPGWWPAGSRIWSGKRRPPAARRPRPRHRLHAHRGVPRADPDAPGGGPRLRRRRHLQPRRVLPDGPGEPPLLPPVHAGEPVLPHQHPAGEHPHPARHVPGRGRGRVPTRTRRPSATPAASTFRSSASAAPATSASTSPARAPESRTRLVTLDPVTRRDAAADFFGEDNVPREAITMGVATIMEAREIAAPRHRRAQGRDRPPGRRGRGRPRRRRHLSPAAPERHVLPRRAAAAAT